MGMKNTAQIFKALGDETRLRIMALLVDGDELCVCDIMAALSLPQSTVSRHLSYLRNSGLLIDRRQGVWMYYRLNRDGVDRGSELFTLLGRMLADLDQAEVDRQKLQDHLERKGCVTCAP